MFQHNWRLRELLLQSRFWRRNLGLVLSGVVLFGGLVACAPTAENSNDTVLENPVAITDESVTDAAPADSENSVGGESNHQPLQDNPEILMIGPRADRNPPLQDCGSLQKQQAMNACAYENYQTVDAELNEGYQMIKGLLPEEGKRSLETAELAWLKFRDLDCEFERSQFEGGSIAPLILNSCLESRTNIRINELYEPVTGQSSYAAADSALNVAYQGLTDAVSDARDEDLVEAQLAWIEYRDRHCKFESNYGAADITVDQCKARLSEKRTRQIRAGIEQNSL